MTKVPKQAEVIPDNCLNCGGGELEEVKSGILKCPYCGSRVRLPKDYQKLTPIQKLKIRIEFMAEETLRRLCDFVNEIAGEDIVNYDALVGDGVNDKAHGLVDVLAAYEKLEVLKQALEKLFEPIIQEVAARSFRDKNDPRLISF